MWGVLGLMLDTRLLETRFPRIVGDAGNPAALRLVGRHPALQSLVLECSNMPPYAAAVQRATGRPVHHLLSLGHERWNAL